MKPIRFICLSVAVACVAATTCAAGPRLFNEIVVFGHSHNDNGNDFLLSGGIAAAPPYFGGRLSNGPLWVEWLANRLGFERPAENRPVPAPREAGGTCYAYGGAATGAGYSDACIGVGPARVCAPNVGLQIDLYFADGRTFDGDELVVFLAGSNDSSAEIAGRNMGEHLAAVAAAGAKTFLVCNEVRLSQDPGSFQAATSWDIFVSHFNAELSRQLDALEARFDIRILRFDLLAFTDAIIARPGDFGLINITDPACPDCGSGVPAPGAAATIVLNPDEYLFWDAAHYTAVVHKLWGDAAADLVLAGGRLAGSPKAAGGHRD